MMKKVRFKSCKVSNDLKKKRRGFIAQFLAVVALAIIVLCIIKSAQNRDYTSTTSAMQNGYNSAIQAANNTISSVS
jgi:hypothetical protein